MRVWLAGWCFQAEEFRQLMQQVTKAQTADLEAMQKAQRVRSDAQSSCHRTEWCMKALQPQLIAWNKYIHNPTSISASINTIPFHSVILLFTNPMCGVISIIQSLCWMIPDTTSRLGGETVSTKRRWQWRTFRVAEAAWEEGWCRYCRAVIACLNKHKGGCIINFQLARASLFELQN